MTRRWRLLLGAGLVVSGLLVAPSGEAGVLDVSWTAPTDNSDGSLLTDLASYRVHYGPTPTCPGSAVSQVASSTPSPGPGQIVSVRLTGLTTGALYYVSVTAVNTNGGESACSMSISGVAQIDFSVSPTDTVSFGDVNVGSFADRVFTVQNPRGGTVSGSASVSSPFSVVSGSPFTLAGSGASHAVTVRFSPTESVTASTAVNFISAHGDTISRLATGSGLGVQKLIMTSQPTITITSPTSNPTYSTANRLMTLGGTASDELGVTWVMWINDLGAWGVATERRTGRPAGSVSASGRTCSRL